MINPIYEGFPDFVTVEGKPCRIITDFREWIRFADMINSRDISDWDKIMLMSSWLDEPQIMTRSVVEALFAFYRADDLFRVDVPADEESGEERPAPIRPPVLDFCIDAKHLMGDFLRYYNIDLTSCEMHWWKFRCLLAALPDDSQVQRRIALRSTDAGSIKDAEKRRRILKAQRQIAIPFEYDDDMIAAAFL